MSIFANLFTAKRMSHDWRRRKEARHIGVFKNGTGWQKGIKYLT